MLLQVSITLLLLGTALAGRIEEPVNDIDGCEGVSCPELWCDNPFYSEGECCQQCPPGCMLNETVWHPVGAIYCDDPCDFCECHENGTSICGKIYCPEVKCENPIHEDGWCCAECQNGGCLYKDALYGSGPMNTGDPCEDCTCDEMGDYTCNPNACETTSECENVACPELPCKEEIALQGECCLYCPPGCTMDDVWYDFGLMEVLDGDVCEECTCEESGSYKCDYKECPDPYSLPCPSEAQFEGQCCTECRPGCTVEAIWYGAGVVPSMDPCQTCTCDEDGSYGCVDNPCPELDCPGDLHIQGECCNSCPPGCFFEESWYGVGPMEQGDACQVCQCTEEGANCAAAACPPADCPEYAQVDGDCGCKVCPPGCRHNDNWYGVGVMEDAEKCGVCTCVGEDEYECVDIPCEPLLCPSSLYVTSDDACCPSCPTGCTYEENWYGVGSMEGAMECGNCNCGSDGSVSCVPYSCPPLPCPAEVQFTPAGECCPQCPAGCEVNANWYGASVQVPSEDPCDTCTCQDNGELDCQRIPCEQPGCSSGYLAAYSGEDGACCPECLRSCRYRGKGYAFDTEVPTRRRCRTCKCGANGRVSCARVACPPLTCPPNFYKYTEYLQCCPTCKPMLK